MNSNRLSKKLLSFNEESLRQSLLNQFNLELREIFLSQGSETEDNLNCVKYVDYGLLEDYVPNSKKIYYGLRIKDTDWALSDIANSIEGLDIPQQIIEEYPHLTKAEWNAVTRMITMILISLQYSQEVL